MLNYYFYLLQIVDRQVGIILNTIGINPATDNGNPLSNTVVIFLSDHGEFGFSHSLRGKGGAAYDEALRIPLYVMLPSQQGSQQLWQMCSEVDFFRFVVDLAMGPGGGGWTSTQPYVDQASRQSLASFIWGGAQETRTVTVSVAGQNYTSPYILETTDEHYIIEAHSGTYGCNTPNHVLCFRTKSNDAQGTNLNTGAKLVTYDLWQPGTTTPCPGMQQIEFYDYANGGPSDNGNRAELGNDAQSANPPTVALLQGMQAALQSFAVQNELAGTYKANIPPTTPCTQT
jgi:Sulfatase